MHTNENSRLSIDKKKKMKLSFRPESEEDEVNDKTIIIQKFKIKAPEQWQVSRTTSALNRSMSDSTETDTSID